MSPPSRLSLGRGLRSVKSTVRRGLDRVDNEEVRWARRIARTARRGGLDVLYLGDSASEWVGPHDTDRRRLVTMLGDRFAGSVAYLPVYGGSYSSDIHDAYLRLATRWAQPQLVVAALCCRVRFRAWREHPLYGRRTATDALRRLDPATPTWRIRRGFAPPRDADWARWQGLPFGTFAGLGTVGEHTRLLKDTALAVDDPVGREKLIYAYHQTHLPDDDEAAYGPVSRFGATLRDAGVPFVVYETPVPVDTGVENWGPQFRTVTEENFARMRAALSRGYGSGVDVVRSGTAFAADEFIDPSVADEHLNDVGRRHLADLIMDRVTDVAPHLVQHPRA